MDEAVRPIEIGNPDGLLFSLSFSQDLLPHEKALAWGQGSVSLGGELVWYCETEDGQQTPIEWTWIDLLLYLGQHWPWLVLEENYPVYPGGRPPATPLDYRDQLAKRWEDLPESKGIKENTDVYLFEERHNLASGMDGIYLPSLIVLREGLSCWLCSPECEPQQRPIKEVLDTLEKLGNTIAEHVAQYKDALADHYTTENDHVPPVTLADEALQWWNSREQRVASKQFQLQTGMLPEALAELQADTSSSVFFETEEHPDNVLENRNSLLAAARLSAGIVTIATQRSLLDAIRNVSKAAVDELDALSAEALSVILPSDKPHTQGYALAGWLRERLQVSPTKPVDPESLLDGWGVGISEIRLDNHGHFAALAFWGDKHGPAILLNVGKDSPASDNHGRRTTLAHEICHMLVDRHTALPAAEVLGGNTPEQPEKRARAFAAEFLLPRDTVSSRIDSTDDIEVMINEISSDFEVSRKVTATQIFYSESYQSLSHDQQIIVRNTGEIR